MTLKLLLDTLKAKYDAATGTHLASAYVYIGDEPTTPTTAVILKLIPETTRVEFLAIGNQDAYCNWTILIRALMPGYREQDRGTVDQFELLQEVLQIVQDNLSMSISGAQVDYQSLEYGIGWDVNGENAQRAVEVRVVYQGPHLVPTA